MFFLLWHLVLIGHHQARAADGLPNRIWHSIEYGNWLSHSLQTAPAPKGTILGNEKISETAAQILLEGKGPLGNPADMDQFCPRFEELEKGQKLQFWHRLFQAIAFAESEYDYDLVYHEKWAPEERGWSVGLLQLSLEDNEYWGCRFSGNDRFAPRRQHENLDCGIEIMAMQVAVCGTLLQGFPKSTNCHGRTAHGNSKDFSFYWSTLNPKDSSGILGFERFRAKWVELTGWDPMQKTRVGSLNEGHLKFCY